MQVHIVINYWFICVLRQRDSLEFNIYVFCNRRDILLINLIYAFSQFITMYNI